MASGKNNNFHSPLHPKDTPNQTAGCRYAQPNLCAKNMMPKVCAFARLDGLCVSPPVSWKNQYLKLRALGSTID